MESDSARRLAALSHQERERQCARCGATFTTRGRGRYCSRACQQKAYMERRKMQPKHGKTQGELIDLIRARGVGWVYDQCNAANLNGALVDADYIDLSNWRGRQTGGAVLFFQVDREGVITADPRVLVVNGPPAKQAAWERIAQQDADAPVAVLMLQP